MKAWQYSPGKPLSLNEVPEPSAGPGEVKIAVHAVGLCHTDVGILEGIVPPEVLGHDPLTLGHEVAGVVTELGEGVDSFAVGDRVAFHMSPAGAGFAHHGGYAAFSVLPAELVVPLPDGISMPAAAAGTDSGMTPYHAVAVAGQVSEGTRVGIIGLGGLGSNGAQIAKALGATVYAVEPRESVRDMAAELGADEAFADSADLIGMDLDVVVDFAGYGETTANAVLAVKPRGTVVAVGAGRAESTLSIVALIQNEVRLVGSSGGTTEDLQNYFQLVSEGKVKPLLSTTTFDEIGAGIERVAAGDVAGRLVAVFQD